MPNPKLTPALVVEAAVALADAEGYDAVSLSEVARRLGVRPPSLYSHVRDLASLRDAIAETALRDLNSRISLAIAGRAGLAALRGLAQAYREFAAQAPGKWQALQRRAGAPVVASDAAREVVALTLAVLRGYPLPETEHVHAVRLLGSVINGYLSLERSGGFDHSDPPADASWDRAIDCLDALFRAWPTTTNQETE